MTGEERTTTPQGLADAGRDIVGPMVLEAWDAFLAAAAEVDLDRPSRLPQWRAHEICVHLGCWDDHTALADLVASARSGAPGEAPDPDAVNARVTAAHRTASARRSSPPSAATGTPPSGTSPRSRRSSTPLRPCRSSDASHC